MIAPCSSSWLVHCSESPKVVILISAATTTLLNAHLIDVGVAQRVAILSFVNASDN